MLTAGGKCEVCGFVLRRTHAKPPRRNCPGLAKRCCPYFLGACDPPQETLVFGCGCASSRVNGKPVSVGECELHGRCITFDRGELRDQTIKRCSECADNPQRIWDRATSNATATNHNTIDGIA